MFYSGQKVVCVDDSPSMWGDDSGVKKGEIYTILEVLFDGEGVTLWEINTQPSYVGYWAHRFRPITEKKTDISVFQEILIKCPQPTETVE